MKEEFFKHPWAYMILFTGLSFLVVLFLAAWPNTSYQQLVILGLITFYSAWGLITHLHHQHLTKRVAAEYLGMAFLAGMLLFLITL
jgi:hypothetical protein